MTVDQQIEDYIASQPQAKKNDLQELHTIMQALTPGSKRWFLDGKNADNKIVSNPNIGYGSYTKIYADGKLKEFYQVGLSVNTAGISVYILGIGDKKFLPHTCGKTIGKASVTGYCIKFKTLKDIDVKVLKEAILAGIDASSAIGLK